MDFGLRTRLFLGYAIAIALFTVAGVYSLHSLQSIDRTVHATNKHPLTVTRAALEAGGQITSMHRYMKDVVLSKTTTELDQYMTLVADLEVDTLERIADIRAHILGADAKARARLLERDFRAWREIRTRVIDLVNEGKAAEAQAITRGAGERHVSLLMDHVSRIRDFASAMAVTFLDEAERTTARTRVIALILLAVAILICLPLAALTASQLQGEMEQRVGAERDLRREEAFIARALDSQNDTFFLFDPATGRALRWNKAIREISGYSDEEIALMKAPDDWYSAADCVKARASLARIDADGVATVDLELKTKSGGRIPTEYVVTVVRDEHGDIMSMISIGRDIRGRVRIEKERQEMEKHTQHLQKLESLGVLAGGIAHDFNNILVGIMGNVGLALSDLPRESPMRECLEDAEQASTRAADLCRQMLAYAGEGRFVVEPVDLTALIDGIRQLLGVSVSNNVDLCFEMASELPPVMADAAQLRQLVLNLVVNGSEAVGEHAGRVVVRTGRVDSDPSAVPGEASVYLEVSDTGCGMDAITQQRMFEPFFTTKFVGRGLGLSAAQGIVRGHKGTMRVTSALGEGTCVKVLFPATEGVLPSVKPPVKNDIDDWRAEGTIVVIDDEVTVLTTTSKSLERAGFTVRAYNDSRDGVARFAESSDDVLCVLLDLTMPDMDGEETLRALQKVDPSVRVLLMSGYDEHDIMRRFEGKHLAGFIQKPFGYATLLETIKSVTTAASA